MKFGKEGLERVSYLRVQGDIRDFVQEMEAQG